MFHSSRFSLHFPPLGELRRWLFLLIFALVALTADAQFLFRISDNDLSEPSYMLGTIHPLSASLLDSIVEYKEAEARCQQMYVEYIPPTNPQMVGDKLFRQNEEKQKAKYPKGKNIFDVIDKESAGILKAKYKEIIPYSELATSRFSEFPFHPSDKRVQKESHERNDDGLCPHAKGKGMRLESEGVGW